MNRPYVKIFIFLILILILGAVSYAVRDFLILGFDGANFGLISIEYVKNTGAAFSLFQQHTTFLIVISVVILVAFLSFILGIINKIKYPDLILYAFMLAGVFCNLFERIIDGFVTDYIRLNFVTFPIFNLSDVFINIGAFLVICNILFNNEHKKSE
ncbi:TPA: signal peptidase II [Candidatus Spyradomonas excrementavium]|nr:signal peptidase II [Candidatus Spyradomonas excrementavium]